MRRDRRRGFSLLELMVATAILGIAVAALLGGLTDSLRAASRAADYDQVTVAARQKMEELLVQTRLPRFQTLEGRFSPTSGWKVRVTPFDVPGQPMPGVPVLDRIALEAWWMAGPTRRSFTLEGYRRSYLRPEDFAGDVLRQ